MNSRAQRALSVLIEELRNTPETLWDDLEVVLSQIQEIHPNKAQPISRVRWVPIDDVQANDYNPNSVAPPELQLLYVSIKADGYTQPVVTVWDPTIKKYVIVDGFHRYSTMRRAADIREVCGGRLPIVVIDKAIADRMAATVRHNRARGEHSVAGMANLVFSMSQEGRTSSDICHELGLSVDELARLQYTSGFAALAGTAPYKPSWITDRQARIRHAWANKQALPALLPPEPEVDLADELTTEADDV